ncbi:MAG: tetratricopeptide repeat protein [Magnetococcales bacterium]|nr:tetratricopeptide repeat protein [Magnetococcales bacterium]
MKPKSKTSRSRAAPPSSRTKARTSLEEAWQAWRDGNPAQAAQWLDRAAPQDRASASGQALAGQLAWRGGRLAEAVTLLEASLVLEPRQAEVCIALGSVRQALGQLPAAEIALRQALALAPNPQVENDLGTVLDELGRSSEALACYQRALKALPERAAVFYNNMGSSHLALNQPLEAIACYQEALRRDPSMARTHSNYLMLLQYDASQNRDALFAAHRHWSAGHCARIPAFSAWANAPQPERVLRIGFLSGDLYNHPVGLFLLPFVEGREDGATEVYCYHNRPREDDVSARLKQASREFRFVGGLSDAALAEAIRQDRIDILVDLAGHTGGHRLTVLARRPAPVQATWLGYWDTTGLPAVDYLLTDQGTVPFGEERWFTERLVRLPGGRFCYTPPSYAPEVAPAPCQTRGFVTFGSFNNLNKVTRQVVALWARCLREVPEARLVLKWRTLAEEGMRRQFLDWFGEEGIAAERLDLRPRSPHPAMLAEYGDLDLALDPFPFSGGLTSFEALWMGVPIVTLGGDRPVSRQTTVFLRGVGLPELAVADAEAYVAKVVELARQPQRLQALRSGLRERLRTSVLCDRAAHARQVGQAFRHMWRRWCAEERLRQGRTGGAEALPLFQESLAALQRGDWLQAESCCLQGLANEPHRPDGWTLRGMILRRAGRAEEALRAYEQAIAADPNYADAHHNRGNLLLGLGRLQEAKTSFEQALRANPQHEASLAGMREVTQRLGGG